MSYCHRRRRPKCDDETEIDWVPHELVEQRGLKLRFWHCATEKIVGDLMQAKQLKMVDQECAGQHEQPANERKTYYRHSNLGVNDLPDNPRHSAPLPEQEYERQASGQDVGATLDRFRDVLRPPFLELLACHHTVLHGEQRHQ